MKERFGLPLALVLIDALTTAAQFRDADNAAENQRALNMLVTIAKEFDTLVVVVDHFGKDASTGTRNASTKEDTADAILALLGEKELNGLVTSPRMALRKVRGGPNEIEIPFRVRSPGSRIQDPDRRLDRRKKRRGASSNGPSRSSSSSGCSTPCSTNAVNPSDRSSMARRCSPSGARRCATSFRKPIRRTP